MSEKERETSIEIAEKVRPPVKAPKESDGRVDRIVQETRQLGDDLSEWFSLRVELIQLDIQERIDQELDFVFSSVIVISMIAIALLMATVAIAFVLGDLLGVRWYGFGIMAVVYVVIGIVVAWLRPRLATRFRASWIRDRMTQGRKSTNGDG